LPCVEKNYSKIRPWPVLEIQREKKPDLPACFTLKHPVYTSRGSQQHFKTIKIINLLI